MDDGEDEFDSPGDLNRSRVLQADQVVEADGDEVDDDESNDSDGDVNDYEVQLDSEEEMALLSDDDFPIPVENVGESQSQPLLRDTNGSGNNGASHCVSSSQNSYSPKFKSPKNSKIKDLIESPILNKSLNSSFSNNAQRPITSYLLSRGSPRALAMLKAVGRSLAFELPANSGSSEDSEGSNQENPIPQTVKSSPQRTRGRPRRNALPISFAANGSSTILSPQQGAIASSVAVSASAAAQQYTSSPSSTTLKRSLSTGDPISSYFANSTSMPSSPKRSSTYVPLSRGSLALRAAGLKSPRLYFSNKSNNVNSSSATGVESSAVVAFSASEASTSTLTASVDSTCTNSSTASTSKASSTPGKSILRPSSSLGQKTVIPRGSACRRSVSFAAPLVTCELFFDAQRSSIGLDRLFEGGGTPTIEKLKPAVVTNSVVPGSAAAAGYGSDCDDTDEEKASSTNGEPSPAKSPICAIKRMKTDDDSVQVTSIEVRSRSDSDCTRMLRDRGAWTRIDLFKKSPAKKEVIVVKEIKTESSDMQVIMQPPALEPTEEELVDLYNEGDSYHDELVSGSDGGAPSREEIISFMDVVRELEEDEAAAAAAVAVVKTEQTPADTTDQTTENALASQTNETNDDDDEEGGTPMEMEDSGDLPIKEEVEDEEEEEPVVYRDKEIVHQEEASEDEEEDEEDDLPEQDFPSTQPRLPSTSADLTPDSVEDDYDSQPMTQTHLQSLPLYRNNSVEDETSLMALLREDTDEERLIAYQVARGDRAGLSRITGRPMAHAVTQTPGPIVGMLPGPLSTVVGDMDGITGEPLINLRMPVALARSFYEYFGRFLDMYDTQLREQREGRVPEGDGDPANANDSRRSW